MSGPELTPNSQPPKLNLERLGNSARRFESSIAAGIESARVEQREINDDTAALIAHVLGRGLGHESVLAEFARNRTGDPEALVHEYLSIYSDQSAPGQVCNWIDWLGTYLIAKTARQGAATEATVEVVRPPQRPQLRAKELTVHGEGLVVHLPPTLTGPELQVIVERLESLPIIRWPAFRSFLTLNDVDGSATNLLECFEEFYVGEYKDEDSMLYALSPLRDWETELGQWTAENRLPTDAVEINRAIVLQQTHEVYDIVERDGVFHVFNK
jgi:hypothetical protein